MIADKAFAERIVGNDEDSLNKLSSQEAMMPGKLSSSFWSRHNGICQQRFEHCHEKLDDRFIEPEEFGR
jgi:hypothetical protein